MPDIQFEAIDPEVVARADPAAALPEIVLFINADQQGDSIRINNNVRFFAQGSKWNDNASSVVVVSGVWEFWSDSQYQGTRSKLYTGYYPNPESMKLGNDQLSSLRCIEYGVASVRETSD